jgi:hypothetical protein
MSKTATTQKTTSLRALKPTTKTVPSTSTPSDVAKIDDSMGSRNAIKKLHQSGGIDLRSGAPRKNIYGKKR